jgi:hypothetical protein
VNPQTGLLEQTIGLSNIGTSAVESAHVIVTGLTNRLYNAAGTNNGSPFAAYTAPLEPGESVTLLLEYYVPSRKTFPVPDSAYIAVGAPMPNLQVTNAPGIDITRTFALTNGSILIEFSSIPGRTYTIYYSSNMNFEEALMAQPPVVAPANQTQWIDDGPPKTISAPPDSPSRFYRVYLNP